MLSGKYSVTIRRPPDHVFDHIVDGTRNDTWRGPVVDLTLIAGDGTAGSVWHQLVRGFGSRVAEADYRVTAFERPTRYAFELVAGPTRGAAQYTLSEPAPDVTMITLELSLRSRGMVPGLTGLVRRQMATELDALDRLKRLLEGAPRDGS
ncbi:MAG: SRPBCC family protein [Candidatus Dormibacter sp.]